MVWCWYGVYRPTLTLAQNPYTLRGCWHAFGFCAVKESITELRSPDAASMSFAPGHTPLRMWAHGLEHTSAGKPGLEKGSMPSLEAR